MDKYGTYTKEAKAKGSTTPNVDALARLASDAYEEHIQNVLAASNHGIRIIPSEMMKGMEVAMLVSPDAYEAFKKRVPPAKDSK